MIGVLNTSCQWCKKETTNKYGEMSYATPSTIPCAVSKEVKLTQTDTGLIKTEEKYYILHSFAVSDGDTLDGHTIAVSEIKDLSGATAYYKAVLIDG